MNVLEFPLITDLFTFEQNPEKMGHTYRAPSDDHQKHDIYWVISACFDTDLLETQAFNRIY